MARDFVTPVRSLRGETISRGRLRTLTPAAAAAAADSR